MSKRLSYEVIKSLSNSKLHDSFLIKDNCGQLYFAKSVVDNPDIDPKLLLHEFERSFNLHIDLNHPQINKAIRKIHLNRKLFYLYSYLSPEKFKPSDYQAIENNEIEFLKQICLLLDYIHLQGVVHCDIKLDNIMVSQTGSFTVMLNDFDLLCTFGYKYDKLIIGSPDHIAPEIYSNSEITPLVDSYALGYALKLLFKGFKNKKAELYNKITSLTEKLLDPNPVHRPYYLLDALAEFEIISAAEHTALDKKLFSSILIYNYKENSKRKDSDLFKVIETSKVIGINEDFLIDLSELKKQSKNLFIESVKKIIADSDLERRSEYWYLNIPDPVLDSFYETLQKHQLLTIDCSKLTDKKNISVHMKSIDELVKKKQFCKALYYYRKIDDTLFQNDKELQIVYNDLGVKIYEKLNKQRNALEYYKKLITLDSENYETLHKYIQLLMQQVENEQADSIVTKLLNDESQITDPQFVQRLYRHKSWLHHAEGNTKEAVKLNETSMSLAKAGNHKKSIIQCLYLSGLYNWHNGDYKGAINIFEEAYQYMQKHKLENSSYAILYSLAALYMLCGRLKKSLQVCDIAMKVALENDNKANLCRISLTKSTNYLELCMFTKSEFWLNKTIHYNHFHYNRLQLFAILYVQSYFYLMKSDFIVSKNYALKALTMCDHHIPQFNQLYLFAQLGKIHFYQSNYEECKKYIDQIINIDESIELKPVIYEMQLFELLNNYVNNNKPLNREKYLRYLLDFKELHVGLPYYYLILAGCLLDVIDDFDSDLISSLKKKDSVIVECVLLFSETVHSDDSSKVSHLKTIYSKLIDASQLFLAYLCSLYIARYYLTNKQEKLAQNYFNNAKKIAEDIGSKQMVHLVEEELLKHQNLFDVDNHLLKVFHDISSIFKNFNTTDNPFQKILNYVLNQTGAERAVLFLKNRENQDLYVKEYINCDQKSLKDIKDYSTSVLEDVIKSNIPKIIDDAQSNKELNIYESIVLYNIKSLVCFPLEKDGDVFGAIYVDHHVLSKIFSQEEITYIKTISQFISFLISISLDQKELRSIKYISRNAEQSKFMTCSPVLLELLKMVPDIAYSSSPVLIVGESGTGKELMAEMIYNNSRRSHKPLVRLNITTIPTELFESDFFGIEDKVATSVQGRMGKLEAADGATLFLDEIGDIPLSVQPKILSALENQYFSRVGSTKMIYTDIRFIYATNKDLKKMMKEKQFRDDLYFRISNFTLHIPPLRERPEDIEMLIDYFSKQNTSQKVVSFSKSAKEILMLYSWPGNVRQLKHTVDSLAWLSKSGVIQVEDLSDDIVEHTGHSERFKKNLSNQEEKKLIEAALKKSNWNQSKAAKLLSMPLATLRYKIKKYGIKF